MSSQLQNTWTTFTLRHGLSVASLRGGELFIMRLLSLTFNNVGRAVTLNARVTAGQNILITGIGGGVALIAMQICLAIGAKVFVTSGSQDKIQRAVSLGAAGGVNYKNSK